MAEKLFNTADVQSKLHRSICMWKGVPVYINCSGMTHAEEIYGTYLLTGKTETIKYTDPGFSYDDIPLGYINNGTQAHYLYTLSLRHSRLGLRVENVACDTNFVLSQHILSQSVHDCIIGKYDSFEDVVAKLRDSPIKSSLAFSRTMCLVKMNKKALAIKYIRTTVGYYDLSTNQITTVPGTNSKLFRKMLKNSGVTNVAF